MARSLDDVLKKIESEVEDLAKKIAQVMKVALPSSNANNSTKSASAVEGAAAAEKAEQNAKDAAEKRHKAMSKAAGTFEQLKAKIHAQAPKTPSSDSFKAEYKKETTGLKTEKEVSKQTAVEPTRYTK